MRGKGNPLAWPVVLHQSYLLRAISFDTAHVIYEWPYGSHLTCIKRVWAEQSVIANHKKDWRLCGQTTTKPFNHTYTSKIEATDETDPEQWAKLMQATTIEYENNLRLVNGHPYWNKAECSTYQLFSCWELVACGPVPDCDESQLCLAVRPFYLTLNATQQELTNFLDQVVSYRELLTAQQILSLKRVEVHGRRYNHTAWPSELKWEVWGLP